jgi:hypothetical protein
MLHSTPVALPVGLLVEAGLAAQVGAGGDDRVDPTAAQLDADARM